MKRRCDSLPLRGTQSDVCRARFLRQWNASRRRSRRRAWPNGKRSLRRWGRSARSERASRPASRGSSAAPKESAPPPAKAAAIGERGGFPSAESAHRLCPRDRYFLRSGAFGLRAFDAWDVGASSAISPTSRAGGTALSRMPKSTTSGATRKSATDLSPQSRCAADTAPRWFSAPPDSAAARARTRGSSAR